MGVEGERGNRSAATQGAGGAGTRAAGGLLLRLATGDARPTFMFRPAWHDAGAKRFLGEQGNFDGADIVRIILEQPACAEFVCGKLVRFFVSEERPQPELVAGLADVMRRSDYQMKPVLEALFRSQAFYAPDIIGDQIKSPVQLVAGAMKQLHAEVTPPQILNLALRQMGQVPFDPPNVAGWDGGKHWITTSTLLARYNFSLFLLHGLPPGGDTGRQGFPRIRIGPERRGVTTTVDVTAICSPEDLKSPSRLVDRLAGQLLSAPLSPAQRAELITAAGQPASDDETRVKQIVHLIMSTPNYQVC
jgi:hypothetical protein